MGTWVFAFGVFWLGWGGARGARHHTLAWGEEIKDRIYLGTSYRWIKSDDPREDKAHFWMHTLMVRPNERLSFGVRVENFNHMPFAGERTEAIYTYSAGLNIMDGRVVLGADFYQATDQRLGDGAYHLTAALEPIDGLILFGDYGDKGRRLYGEPGKTHRFGMGVRLNLAEMMFSSYNAFNRDGKFFRGNLATGSFREQRRTIIHPRREVADFPLGGRLVEKPPPHFFLRPALVPNTKSLRF